MIPPLKDVRLRSIKRWLTESHPSSFGSPSQSAALDARARSMDARMVKAFEDADEQLLLTAASSPGWGFEEATGRYRMQRIELWQGIVAEAMPVADETGAD